MKAMLKIKDLKVSYGKLRVLKGVNLEIREGECVGVIGESGTGKTTLALSIMRLIGENGGANVGGEILYKGKNLLKIEKEVLRKIRWNNISIVFQNKEDALNPVYSVLDQVKEPLIEKGVDKKEATERAIHFLTEVGLPSRCIKAYPHELSEGEKQRCLLAMALVNNPGFLILDEPVSSLDTTSKIEAIAKINVLCRGRSLLVLTHDISSAAKLTDKIAVLYGGKIVELAATPLLLSRPRHPYTRGLLRSYPNMTTTKDLQGMKGRMEPVESGCSFYPRCTQAVDICRQAEPELKRVGERFLACHRGGIIPFLEIANLTKIFGSFKAINSVSLTLYEGETLALVGESGAGKTTLAKSTVGILEPEEGEVYLEGKKVTQRDKKFYKKVQMIFQNPRESLSHRLNVLEAVREPLDIHNSGPIKEREKKVAKVLAEVELPSDGDFVEKYPHQLSGGEVQRVVIARALILNPKILVADEPTSSLDASVQAKIVKLLLSLQEKRGLGILFITHDIALARKVSDRLAVMLQGRIIEEGLSSKVVSNPSELYTKNLLQAASTLDVDVPNDRNLSKSWQKEISRSWSLQTE